jgi:hypothetical protein
MLLSMWGHDKGANSNAKRCPNGGGNNSSANGIAERAG